ncbi:L-threonine 3-dehydrogenase [subsurface metagenome]
MANGIIFKGAVVVGISGRKMFDTWYRVANLLESKRIDISPIITHKFPLDEYEKGFNLMMSKERKAAKILLFP